jgi:hypothetical protein
MKTFFIMQILFVLFPIVYTHTSQIEWFDLNNQFSIIWITFVVNYNVDTYNFHCPHTSTIAVNPQESKPKTQNY